MSVPASPTCPAAAQPLRRGRVTIERGQRRLLAALVLVVVLTQRLAVPMGSEQLPLALPLSLLLLAGGLAWGLVHLDAVRVRLYALAVGLPVLLTLVAFARGGTPSVTSVLFLVGLYPLAALRPLEGRRAVDPVLNLFVRVMVVAALVGLAQMATQYAGLPYRDWLAVLVPEPFLLQGYNTADPIAYGSWLYRANGVIFLEPSFYAIFLALALLVVLRRGHGTLTAALLAAALIPPLAGNGFVVLLPGLLVLALTPGRRRLRLLILPVTVALALAALTPLGSMFLHRSTEVSNSGSSSSLRLVEPYTAILPAFLRSPEGMLLGNGAGSVGAFLQTEELPRGLITPILPKLLYEYGLLAALLFMVFVLHAFWVRWDRAPWAPGLLLAYLILNPALLQPTLALTAILFLSLIRPTDRAVDRPAADITRSAPGPTAGVGQDGDARVVPTAGRVIRRRPVGTAS